MVDRHCPFLNRDDPRCAAHFRVNQLGAAFEHCAGEYASCTSYRELLAERIMHRAAASRTAIHVRGQPYADQFRTPIVLTSAAPRWSVTARGLVDARLVVAAR